MDPWDEALLAALERSPEERLLTLPELAEASNFSTTLLEVVIREGFLTPVHEDPEPLFELSDAETLRAGLALVEAGLPLGELLDLARRTDAAMRPIAERAVEVFARYVRDSVEANARSDDEAVRKLVAYEPPYVDDSGQRGGAAYEGQLTRLLAEGNRLEVKDFGALKPGLVSADAFDLPPGGVDLEELEKNLVVQALRRAGGNQTKAAALLGLNRDQIRYRVEKFGLTAP